MKIIRIGLLTSLVMTVIVLFAYIYLTRSSDSTYQNELPAEPSKEWLELFRDSLFYDKDAISEEEDDGVIYQENNIIDPERKIQYSFSPTNKIHNYYTERLHREEDNKYAYNQVNIDSLLEEPNDLLKYHLPVITLKEDTLHIKTAETEASWTTLKANDMTIEMNDIHTVSIKGIKDDVFYLSITTDGGEKLNKYLVYMHQDLSKIYIVNNNEDEEEEGFQTFLKAKAFELYQELYSPIDEAERYRTYESNHQVIDTVERKLIAIDLEDYLSEDGKYVYLDGSVRVATDDKLEEGTQYIQTLEDYLADNEEYALTFNLNYKDILKASNIEGIGSRFSDTSRGVVYFKNEMIVIHITYDAVYFGVAGDTNLVIDFSEDKENPKIYVVNLSMS